MGKKKHSLNSRHRKQFKTQNEIFSELLEGINEVDFLKIKLSAKGGSLKSTKLLKQDYIVTSIDIILKFARKNNWNLCKKNDSIFLYNGRHWECVEKAKFQVFLGKIAQKLGVEKNTAKYYLFKEDLFKQFLSTAYLEPPSGNANKTLVNLENGTFEVSQTKQILKDFKPKDFLVYQLNFPYSSKLQAKTWKKFLNEVLPDKEKQIVLAEYLAYIFIKPSVLKLEKILILYGSGANGKSVVFEVVSALLGHENISNYSLQKLTSENGYHRAKIGGKLLNYASELNGRLETDVFKQLASGEPIEARLPYGEPFILREYSKFIFNCNTLPRDVEHTDAFFRRFMIIHFDITIPEEKQNKSLSKEIINNELSGVFNWVLEGLERLLKNKKFSNCMAVDKAKQLYENESDSVKSFLDEYRYTPSVKKYTQLKIMYNQYRTYCIEDGFKFVNKTNFKKRLDHYKMYVKRASSGYVSNAIIN